MSILDKATLHLPMGAAYKSGSVWMSKPLSDDGYFAVSRNTVGTRTTDCGEVGTVAAENARLNYRDGIPCMLIEGSKTNLIPSSENASTGSVDLVTIQNNTVPSPSGLINADSVIESASSGRHILYYAISATNNSSAMYSFSCYVKSAGRRYVALSSHRNAYISGTSLYPSVVFDLQDGVVTYSTSQLTKYGIESAGDGWFRIFMVNDSTGTSNGNWVISLSDRSDMSGSLSYSSPIYTGNGSSGIYVFGVQLEQSKTMTSYIKTTGSTVSRSNDSIRITGNRALPYIGGSQGTIYFYVYYKNNVESYQQFMYYTDASSSQSYMYVNQTRYIQTNPNLGSMQSNTQLVDGSFNKVAVKYMPGKAVMYLNGQVVATSTPSTILNHANIDLGSYAGVSEFGAMEFVEYAHFNQALSDSELITLTTL